MFAVFNSKWKFEFIEQYSTKRNIKDYHRRIVERTFNRVGNRIEDIYDKDACNLSYNEIKDGLATFGGTSYSYLSSLITLLDEYTDWCIDNHLSESLNNPYKIIKAEDIDVSESFSSTMLKGYDDFASFLDCALKPIGEGSSHNMYRAILWMVFFGINLDDIESIKCADFCDGVLKVGNQSFDFNGYPEAYKAIESAKSQTNYSNAKGYVEYNNTTNLIKSSRSSSVPFKRRVTLNYTKIMSKFRAETGEYGYTISDIERSGLFWRMYTQEMTNGEIARNDIANDYVYSNYVVSNTAHFTSTMKHLMEDYNRWKKSLSKA